MFTLPDDMCHLVQRIALNYKEYIMMKAVLVCILVGLLVLFYCDPSLLSSFGNSTTISSSKYTVVHSPTMSAGQVNSFLCVQQSPACGTGDALFNYARQYGIDDKYALAVFTKESSDGKAGVAAITHSLGNIRCTPGYSCYQGYRSYVSWADGYKDFFQLIRSQYVDTWHLSTVDAITLRYAPSTENNTQKYISDVEAFILQH